MVAFLGGMFLLATANAWLKIYRKPKDDLTAASDTPASDRLKSAALLTGVSLGLSGLAAILAVVDWWTR
ncbi:MAG TPA: hypothetical protein VFK58_07195 [Sphingomicrobium sp.]|nr:hypothetical protein [Sphingomicrobium sp.]